MTTTLETTTTPVYVGYIQTMPVPVEQELTHNLMCSVKNNYIKYDCPESMELLRRLREGTIPLDTFRSSYGQFECVILRLAKNGQWSLLCELFERIDWESINRNELWIIYRKILDYHGKVSGNKLDVLKAAYARGIRTSYPDALLQMAARYDDGEVLMFIVETLGATVDTLNTSLCFCSQSQSHTMSPLCTAVYFANVSAVRYLLSVKADVALEGVSNDTGCPHSPRPLLNVLIPWVETVEFGLHCIHPYTCVENPAAALAEIAEMLDAVPPRDEQELA